jgi:Kdo2-lipid IVA lauroyltransferase/acyltransferase
VTLENLAIAFPEHSPAARRTLGRASFRHLGMTLVESAILLVADPAVMLARVSIDGLEHLRQAAGSPGGVLLLTGHFGNWELLGLAHVLSGLPLAVVVRPLDSRLLNRLAERLRARTGAELIVKRRALPAVIDALRRGRMIGVLLDQNASRAEGVFVPFFGRPASTSRSLALLSLRTGRPIVPVFIHRERDGRHRIVVEAALGRPATESPAAVLELTAECAARTEATIRRWPEQWFWLHRRWRTRPSAP